MNLDEFIKIELEKYVDLLRTQYGIITDETRIDVIRVYLGNTLYQIKLKYAHFNNTKDNLITIYTSYTVHIPDEVNIK